MKIKCLDTSTGDLIWEQNVEYPPLKEFTRHYPAESFIAHSGTHFVKFDINAGKTIHRIETIGPQHSWSPHAHRILTAPSITISPDKKVLAACYPNEIIFRNYATGKPLQTLKKPDKEEGIVQYSPDSHYLATTAVGKIYLWENLAKNPDYTIEDLISLLNQPKPSTPPQTPTFFKKTSDCTIL